MTEVTASSSAIDYTTVMNKFRGMAVTLASVALMGMAACGGGDGDNDVASSDTTAAVVDTTEAEDSVTTVAPSGVSPCLTADEVTALAGVAPDRVNERENSAKKWPSGDCRYYWTSLNAEVLFYIDVRSDAATYYDQQVARTKAGPTQQEMASPGLGDKSYMSRNTGNRMITGLLSTMFVQDGDVYLSQNFADGQAKLKPSVDADTQLAIAIAGAQLAKIQA